MGGTSGRDQWEGLCSGWGLVGGTSGRDQWQGLCSGWGLVGGTSGRDYVVGGAYLMAHFGLTFTPVPPLQSRAGARGVDP